MAADEIFDIVDEAGRKVGQAARSRVHGDPSLIHRSVHLLVLNSRGELYLQKRADHKDIQPGKWDTSVGGHVGPGESPAEAVEREAAEELGLRGVPFDFLYNYLWRTPVETELVSTFLCRWDGPVRFDPGEITDGGFRSFDAIEAGLGTGVFTPNFEEEFSRLKQHLERQG